MERKGYCRGGKVWGEIKDEAREGGRMGCEDGGGEEDKKQTLRHTVDVIYSVHAIKIHMPNFDIWSRSDVSSVSVKKTPPFHITWVSSLWCTNTNKTTKTGNCKKKKSVAASRKEKTCWLLHVRLFGGRCHTEYSDCVYHKNVNHKGCRGWLVTCTNAGSQWPKRKR